MKKIVLVFVLFFTLLSYSQMTKQKATLYFKDGKELSCFARISGDYIRYSESDFKSSETKVNHEELLGIGLWMEDKKIHLYYKTEKGKDKPRLMELVIDGKVKLYRVADKYGMGMKFATNPKYIGKKTSSTAYFLETKENPDFVFRFLRKFNENAKNYFSDCETLANKIGESGFRQKDIRNIVIYYNENCQ